VPIEPRLDASNTDDDALLVPVDYDDALGAEAVNGASLFVIDDAPQYSSVADRHWSGFREPDGELAQVVAGELAVPSAGRRVFLDMGIAMDDVALGALCYDRALERGVGRSIAFP
jgi:ornithine cyclodeaminase/alanine dehydrogenase-like protein (mu-crystallin family)